MKFKSKIDWWLHLVFIFGVFMTIWPLILGISNKNVFIIIIAVMMIFIVDVLLVLPIYFSTFYVLEDTSLYIRSGLCMNKRITYISIKEIKETRSPIASAGLSLDRIRIRYTGNNMVLISPKNKQEFINQLKLRTVKQ